MWEPGTGMLGLDLDLECGVLGESGLSTVCTCPAQRAIAPHACPVPPVTPALGSLAGPDRSLVTSLGTETPVPPRRFFTLYRCRERCFLPFWHLDIYRQQLEIMSCL